MTSPLTPRRAFIRTALAAATLAAAGLGGAAHADMLANIQKAGVLRVAIPQDFPPFGSLGTDLKLQGYDIDMAALVAQELGVKVELVPVTSTCLLYTSPSPRDQRGSRMPSSA